MSQAARRPWPARRLGLSWAGIAGAVVGFTLALTPSLLPRPGLYLGIIAGFSAAFGYGLAVLASWGLRKAGIPEPSPKLKRQAWLGLYIVAPVVAIIAMVLGAMWQREVDRLVGEAPVSAEMLLAFVLAIVFFALVIAVARGIRGIGRWVGRIFDHIMPTWLARVLGAVVVALVLYWLAAGLLFNGFITLADNIYASTNSGTDPGVHQPVYPERSGSSASLAAWSSLGIQGRTFVGTGPNPTSLQAFSGQPAMEPIRVYVGLDTAATARERANLAVKELERTGAFNRKVLVVAGATGTGWIEPQAADSIEYMYNGDSAIATIQYSYLPSWISFLVDKDRAALAGVELFDAVHAQWAKLPADHRPKLIAYGLSLGSFAAQSAFGSPADIATRTDGALFIGSPNFSEPWGNITAGRDPGSPEWQPIYRNGVTVRFASKDNNATSLPGTWTYPRVLYLQHGSDPVVWWSFDLLTREPDWLKEPPAPDVSPAMHWFPFITFLQVTVDQFFGTTVPQGHGHNYASEMPAAWASVAAPAGWTDADTARLQVLIDKSL